MIYSKMTFEVYHVILRKILALKIYVVVKFRVVIKLFSIY